MKSKLSVQEKSERSILSFTDHFEIYLCYYFRKFSFKSSKLLALTIILLALFIAAAIAGIVAGVVISMKNTTTTGTSKTSLQHINSTKFMINTECEYNNLSKLLAIQGRNSETLVLPFHFLLFLFYFLGAPLIRS